MQTPSTDSLYDGRENLHQFTDPMSSNFWETREMVLPSSPPADDVPMEDEADRDAPDDAATEDDATDADTDEDEPCTMVHRAKTNTLTALSQNSAAQAVHKRSLSIQEIDASVFAQRVVDDPDTMIDSKGTLQINFEGACLCEIPADWTDLRHVYARNRVVEIKMFLAKNMLRQLPLFVFDLNITVLSLRDNELRFLPAAVANLRNLRELHLGGNQLEFLPYELTSLESLRTLTCTPNPLLQPSSLAQRLGDHPGDRSQEVAFESRMASEPPSLSALSMASYCDGLWPQHMTRLSGYMQQAISAARVDMQRCYRCRKVYVHEGAAVIKWLNVFRQANVPFKLGFCTRECYFAHAFPHSSDAV